MYLPNENIKPVEPISVSRRVVSEPILRGSRVQAGKSRLLLMIGGRSTANCKYLKEIPEALAVSILPGLRHTKDVANCAKLYHKLTMLHLPLEALHNYDFYPRIML